MRILCWVPLRPLRGDLALLLCMLPVPRFRELFKTSPRAASSETEKVLRKTPRSLTELIEKAIHLTVWLECTGEQESDSSRNDFGNATNDSVPRIGKISILFQINFRPQCTGSDHWLRSLAFIHGYLQTLLTCFDNVLLRPYQ